MKWRKPGFAPKPPKSGDFRSRRWTLGAKIVLANLRVSGGTHAGGECGWLFHFQMYSSRVKTEKHIYWLVLPFASGDNMKKVFHNAIKTQISSLTDNNFQNFIDELYSKLYGSEYLSIKQKRDKGCDGIIINEKKS